MIDRKLSVRIYRVESEMDGPTRTARGFNFLMLARRLSARRASQAWHSDTRGLDLATPAEEAPSTAEASEQCEAMVADRVLERLAESSHLLNQSLLVEQTRIERFAQAIAEGVVEFCCLASIERTGNWDVALPLNETFPRGSQLLVTLTFGRLSIVFDIPDEQILTLLMNHVDVLTSRIDVILRKYGHAREIEIGRR
ncbi:type III secretion inner membrane protein SctQ [Caballeronia calidae]|uniref:Type III secretion inner membrane protein SctQ n=1 Tax=Caballeronia calidae TaxID=1777139 RepID=A0A158EG08_9BURK|nr:type III secretion HpaP family protein [Caballeronia calidae]SAL05822.1 type III secretion inner membrane protein SctQ [Caballeronia calidae]